MNSQHSFSSLPHKSLSNYCFELICVLRESCRLQIVVHARHLRNDAQLAQIDGSKFEQCPEYALNFSPDRLPCEKIVEEHTNLLLLWQTWRDFTINRFSVFFFFSMNSNLNNLIKVWTFLKWNFIQINIESVDQTFIHIDIPKEFRKQLRIPYRNKQRNSD